MKNHYITLGLERNAQQPQIKEAYHKLALKWHPDKNTNCRAQAITQFQEINEAYNTLSQSESKKKYDYKLEKNDHSQKLKYFLEQIEEMNEEFTYLSKDDQDTLNKFINRINNQSKRIRKH
ncbi:unnamed protein product (macronuclear) [Paramecium tetraurelia]|uniref:J domain-containing protein n=1 Tax=Paramecium tetraurelia TaxID=5888 RepID=A0EFK4_PARTE|nr:uncharacterized protein GSPATT00026418001 [Paramecium tetraurelia]CAK94095.1 unnamed protein product [Paramecium tetraurelia]|eukprot:XP_001461468.1 hypothetical protein (macronuclear) [Paramecium tetraurelia strain d4-2]